jgi:hypothetical protein
MKAEPGFAALCLSSTLRRTLVIDLKQAAAAIGPSSGR